MATAPKPITPSQHPIAPGASIGHVHLKVSDLDRAIEFYRGVLGFDLMQRYGDAAAFLSAGGYHHHIALNTWESKGGSAPPSGSTGLYHFAIRYPTRRALADGLRRILHAGIGMFSGAVSRTVRQGNTPELDRVGMGSRRQLSPFLENVRAEARLTD